jgi:hypothetical protein
LFLNISGHHHDIHGGRGAFVILADVVRRKSGNDDGGMHPHEGLGDACAGKLSAHYSAVSQYKRFVSANSVKRNISINIDIFYLTGLNSEILSYSKSIHQQVLTYTKTSYSNKILEILNSVN